MTTPLEFGDWILHYTSPERWKTAQAAGFLEANSPPYHDSERDMYSQRGVLAYSPYLVGLLDPGGWNRNGLMDHVIGHTSSPSGTIILGVPIREKGWAFVREHKHQSPEALREKCGYDLYKRWNSHEPLNKEEIEIVNEARRQYLESSIPLAEYKGEYEVPEVWLPQ